MTDSELLRQTQAGDKTALRTLYERYWPSVWRYAYAQVDGDCHAAEDVVSETFLAAVRTLDTLDAERVVFSGWLIGIARHKIADQRRRARLGERARNVVLQQSPETHEPDSAGRLEGMERRAKIATALDGLPAEERLVLEWKYLEDLSVRQIAGRLGRTEKAVEALLYRARHAFRSLLGDLS